MPVNRQDNRSEVSGKPRDAGGAIHLPTIVYVALPVAIVLPPLFQVNGVRLNWHEIFLIPALFFFSGWRRNANNIVMPLIGLSFATAISILVTSSAFNLTPHPRDFSLFKYTISYIAALQIGMHLPGWRLRAKNPFALLAFFYLIAIVFAAYYSESWRIAIAAVYGHKEQLHIHRFQLLGPNPIQLGSTSLILFFFASRGWRFQVRLTFFVLSLFPIILAQQRATAILAAMLFAMSEYILLQRNVVRPLIVSVLLFIAGVSLFWTYDGSGYTSNRFSKRRMTAGAMERVEAYKIAIAQFAHTPLFGIGRHLQARGEFISRKSRAIRSEPHNQYAGILYEVGILGAIPFFWLLVNVKRNAGWMFRYRMTSEVARISLTMVTVYAISMLVWESLYVPMWSVFFFLCLGFLVSARGRSKPVAITQGELQ